MHAQASWEAAAYVPPVEHATRAVRAIGLSIQRHVRSALTMPAIIALLIKIYALAASQLTGSETIRLIVSLALAPATLALPGRIFAHIVFPTISFLLSRAYQGL